ncbi:rpoE leader peptide RseD [Klebsiella grimontii]|nr:rpoE leader peptide RseD [Klebsiella sp. FDAARGOS_511]MBF8458648.1 rpoE leader peptide RseD [Klebsiella michiganensis]MBZ7399117.1 rpoE leader peptide RseD [Klebsiella grimontii]MBZ7659975.1 rpoE leader peptide RseD [Klebsiella grimontii]
MTIRQPVPDEKLRRNGTLLFSDTPTLCLLIYAVIGWCF